MLRHLLIRNIALVDELSLSFEKGLNVLSGETGAGKSIIVESVSFLLGGKADKDIIRSGSSKAYVEGIFDVDNHQEALSFLADNAIEPDDDMLIMSREFTISGRSVYRVGGLAVSLSTYKHLSVILMDIHGQHEHQSLLDERKHLAFLDDFGKEDHRILLKQVQSAYESYFQLQKEYDQLVSLNASRQERLDLLRIQEKDISGARVETGEEEKLKDKLDRLRNLDKIRRSLKDAYTALYDSKRDENSALELLRQAKNALCAISAYDESYDQAKGRIESLYYEAEDIGLELRSKLDSLDTDGGTLQATAERLDLLKRLTKKYGLPSDDFADKLDKIRQEIKQFESMDERLDSIERTKGIALKEYDRFATALSYSRKTLALWLQKLMEQQLNTLNMSGTKFIVEIDENTSVRSMQGKDQVRMLLAPNRGEEAKPLARIASGGESSRLMLALKTISAQHNAIPSMVFDEIDTGISGRTAQVVSEKLWDIARYRQVLCVTHLQQIAAMASSHFLVEKYEADDRTHTIVRLLSDQERVVEIGRMISGISQGSKSSIAHAQHMLCEANEYRKQNPSQ